LAPDPQQGDSESCSSKNSFTDGYGRVLQPADGFISEKFLNSNAKSWIIRTSKRTNQISYYYKYDDRPYKKVNSIDDINYLLVKRNQKFFKFLGLTSKKQCRDNFDSEKVMMKALDFTMMDVKINPKTNFFGYTRKKKIAGYPNEKYKLEGIVRRPRVSEAVGRGKGGGGGLSEKIFLLDFNRFTQYMHYAYYTLAMELWPFHWFKFSTNILGGINFHKRKDLYFSVFLIMHEIIGKGFLSEFSLKRIMKKTCLFKSVYPKIVIKKLSRSANDMDNEYNPKSVVENLEQILDQSFVEQ
jgi:hypothetical protein